MSFAHPLRLSLVTCTFAIVVATTWCSRPALAQVGSYTLGTLFPNTTYAANDSVFVTAKDKDGNEYKPAFGIQIGGLTTQQARDLIVATLRAAGWAAEPNPSGSNSIIIRGRYRAPNATPKDSTIVPMKQVDMHLFTTLVGGNIRDYFIDGDAPFKSKIESPKDFKFSFVRPNAGGSSPGTLFCDFNAIHVATALPANATPLTAAMVLESMLTGAGFVVTRVDSTVTLNWDVPANAALLGSSLHINFGVQGGSGGPHVQLTLPNVVLTMPSMGAWAALLAAAALGLLARMRLRDRREGMA